jgi:hypothetical protein
MNAQRPALGAVLTRLKWEATGALNMPPDANLSVVINSVSVSSFGSVRVSLSLTKFFCNSLDDRILAFVGDNQFRTPIEGFLARLAHGEMVYELEGGSCQSCRNHDTVAIAINVSGSNRLAILGVHPKQDCVFKHNC